MTTRFRALVLTTFTSLLVFISLAGIELFDYRQRLNALGINDAIVIEFITAAVISIVVAAGVLWVLFFKRKGNSFFAIGLFPAMALFPYILLADSIIKSIFSGLGQLSIALIASVVYWIACYLLILTANVLNGAILFNIPLGQAGKASQFIFSLISSYFLIAFLYGASFTLGIRTVLIGVFVFYFAYSTIWASQQARGRVVMRALAIMAVMVLLTLLLSIWPVSSVYATLVAVVVLYILLNVGLETREHIGRMVWIEYTLLLVLVAIILFTNGVWGVNGTLI